MLGFRKVALVAATVAGLALGAAATAEAATCVKKAGQGTGQNEENAKFQAWEAVLQATDWGMWASWMASSTKVGVAPGYKVTGLKSKCTKGTGLGNTCVLQASLCK
jgi:hypothetical protein